MSLFQSGDFTLHSGDKSNFKIECNSLTNDDWECIAALLLERLPKFRIAVGIPQGGLKLAEIMDRSATRELSDPILVVDDVFTTGQSFKEFVKIRSGKFIGAVAFARNPTFFWVTPLFQLYEQKAQPITRQLILTHKAKPGDIAI